MRPAFYTGEEIRGAITFAGLIEQLREGHRHPPPDLDRLLMAQKAESGPENSFLLLPAWNEGQNLGVKVITVFPDNPSKGPTPPSVQALYLLFDGQNGSPLAILDGTELTYWKTAADSALGADYLARRDAKTLLVVGTGALAPYVIRAYLAIRPGLERIMVWNRTPAKAEALVANWEGPGKPEVVADLAKGVADADIISCVTASTSPLVQGNWLAQGSHLDLIGGFTPEMREADDEAVRRASIFVDSRWFTIEEVGDLTQPMEKGIISPDDVRADLYELCDNHHPGRRSEEEITLFKSGGGAHLDLMAAQYILNCLDD